MTRTSLDVSLKRLTRACYGAGALLTIALCGFAVKGIASAQNVRDLQRKVADMNKRLAEDQSKVDQAKKISTVSISNGLDAAGAFQARLESIANRHTVEVAEVRSGTELMPFLSLYVKNTPNEGWTQVDAKATLRGRLIDVMGCLTDLSHERIPFEFDTIELTRVAGEPGAILVTANVQMRVLTKTEKRGKS